MPPIERDVYLAFGEQEAKEEQDALDAAHGRVSNNVMSIANNLGVVK